MAFTMDEINLICIYDTNDRGRMLTGIRESLPYFLEPELKELAQDVIRRLEAMTDREFAALDLAPEYDDEEETEVQQI
nr:transposon-transfer assisting family protein [Sedimentibacter sp.]